MKASIVNLLNGILGAGNNRRSHTLNIRVDDTKVWEVRPKFESKRGMTPIKDSDLKR